MQIEAQKYLKDSSAALQEEAEVNEKLAIVDTVIQAVKSDGDDELA